jgi:hypothetical protein
MPWSKNQSIPVKVRYKDGTEVLQYADQLTDRQKYDLENQVSRSTGRRFQQFYLETKIYITNARISSNSNAITFINTGSVNLTINDLTLAPGQSFGVTGNDNEIDTTQYNLVFPSPNAPGNGCTVIRKLMH